MSVALTALYAVVAATASAEPTLPADTAGAPPGGRGEEAAAGAPAGGELGAPPVGSGDERAAGVPVGGGFAVVPSSEPYV